MAGRAYKSRHGLDWPADMADEFIDMTVAKKWRMIESEVGVRVKDPWVPLLGAATRLLPDEYFRVSEWTEQHFHDFVMHDKLVTWGCASSGKSLCLDETVFFPDRVGRVEDVRPGDFVLSATGRPTRVRAVFRHFDKPLYRVRFTDGTSAVCCGEHLWTVRYWGRVRWGGPRASRRAVCGWVERTRSAAELASLSGGRVRGRRMSIPLTAPLEFSERPVPLDPYVLGCLLGAGSTTGTVTLSSARGDAELRAEFASRLPEGCVLKGVGSSETSCMVVKADGSRGENAVVSALKRLGLRGRVSVDKFVPDAYKVNSASVRFGVLAGLLDTDGAVSKDGGISFTSVSPALAEDVRWLAESVGARATVTSKVARAGRAGPGRLAHTVRIAGLGLGAARRLFRLTRKRDRLREPSRGVGVRDILSVEPVSDRGGRGTETRCIALDERDVDGNPVRGLFPIHDFIVTHNSNDTALLLLLDWAVDPYDTVTLLGSTTKEDLRSRSWEAVVRYHNALCRNPLGLAFPGRIRKQGQSLVNVEEDDAAESSGEKAGIQGRALNEDGRLQGAHAKHVRLVVDELAEISNHEAVKVAMANLRVGTLSFKFIGLANPGSWENPSCQYCMPEGGPAAVTPDTGSWTSTFGCFVRHHDGLKSPCVLDPSKRARFPFLLSSGEVEAILREAGGNADAPQFWKMVRGFPAPAGAALPTVLDPRVARRERVGEPNASPDPVVRAVAGIDPAWTQGGDGAFRARAYVRRDPAGRFYLDFTDGLDRLHILASDPRPPVQQMRDQVVQLMRRPGEASFHDTAVDSSANQGLGDDLLVYAGADCLQVNSAVRAGEAPLRGAGDVRPARETVHDRGTEAWCVLAEFCKAGQVRGLPPRALEALVTRRFAMRTARDAGGRRVPTGPAWPLRLEDKAEFRKRFKGSPDECDACALAALAAKERAGLAPYGFMEELPSPFSLVPRAASAAPAVSVPESAGLVNDPDGGAGGGFSIDPCDVF